MKNTVLATVALLVCAAGMPAAAADMPLKAPVKAPIVLDPWTGFYIGANTGYSWGNWDSTNTSNGGLNFPTGAGVTATSPGAIAGAVTSDFTNTASPNVQGWVAGGQFGVNKLYGSWLYGLEADLQATGQQATDDGTALIANINLAGRIAFTETLGRLNSWKLPWFATFRGRVGAVYDQTWLFYVTGGLAVARAEYSSTSTQLVVNTAPVAGTIFNSSMFEEGVTKPGLAVGAGIEKAIDAHWRVKAEYLYIDFGSHTFLSGTGLDTSIHMRDNIARLGINYRFLP